MKPIYPIMLILSILVSSTNAYAQKNKTENPEKAIKTTIDRFFKGMEMGDTVLLKSACMPSMILQTYMADKEGNMEVYTEDFATFLDMIGAPKTDHYEERIKYGAIQMEKSLASVWAPYAFYINGKRSHCGTDSFQLVKTLAGWKIQYILDTRRKEGCKG